MIDIKISGVDSAINALKKYSGNELERKAKLLIEKAAERGYNSASINFQVAIYAGTNDVVVHEPYWDGDILILAAEGNSVAFIEFGTGVHYSEVYPKNIPDVAKRGTYGKGKGSNDSWVYVGDPGTGIEGEIIHIKKDGRYVVKTHGNPPARALYNAKERMREEILKWAKEIFRK